MAQGVGRIIALFFHDRGTRSDITVKNENILKFNKYETNYRGKKANERKKNVITFVAVTHTGCFIMYSGIINIYYRKTVGHIFTKPVQIERTTQKSFSQ